MSSSECETSTSSMGEVSNASEDSCSTCFEIEILDETPSIEDITLLLSSASYITDPVGFLSKAYCCKSIKSGDTVLGVCALVKYDDVRRLLAKGPKKAINSLLESAGDTSNISLLFMPRIANLPLETVYSLYSEINGQFERCIVVSRLSNLKNDEVQTIKETFPEFDEKEIRQFPVNNEEVLLLHSKYKRNTEINGAPARIYLIEQQEFKEFLIRFEKEISE